MFGFLKVCNDYMFGRHVGYSLHAWQASRDIYSPRSISNVDDSYLFRAGFDSHFKATLVLDIFFTYFPT